MNLPKRDTCRRKRPVTLWSIATVAAMVAFTGTTEAQSPANPTATLILGELTSISVRDVNDPASGGHIAVDGKQITIPDRLLVGLPSGRVPFRDLMREAPAECKSEQPAQSGLAVSDSCRGNRPPALARVVATPNASGELVASLLMIQKDSAQTLARIRPEGRSRAGSYGQKPSDGAAYPKKSPPLPKR